MATTTTYTSCTACCGGVTVPCSTDAIPTSLTATISGGTGGFAPLNGLSCTLTYVNALNNAGSTGYWYGTLQLTYPGSSGTCCLYLYLYCAATGSAAMAFWMDNVIAYTSCPAPFTSTGESAIPLSTSPFHYQLTHTETAARALCSFSTTTAVGDQYTVDITA